MAHAVRREVGRAPPGLAGALRCVLRRALCVARSPRLRSRLQFDAAVPGVDFLEGTGLVLPACSVADVAPPPEAIARLCTRLVAPGGRSAV